MALNIPKMIKYAQQSWNALNKIHPHSYICGFCGDKVASDQGYFNSSYSVIVYIYICPACGWPTFFDTQKNQYPGPMLGRSIKHLPENIEIVYNELREDIKNSSYTSAVLLGRKLIMHLAVDIAKAPEGESFVKYITHLKSSGYIPPNGDKWLEYMKDMGNEKNHEIKIGGKEEAERIIKFVEMLLIFIYEFSRELGQTEGEK